MITAAEQPKKAYPVGIQTFSEIIESKCLYIDKTEYIYKMTRPGAKYFFLSRPRRFGKSLLLSTLRAYFEGRKDLFKGLALERLETEWNVYPVLHFSLSTVDGKTKEELISDLDKTLRKYEEIYNRDFKDIRLGQRLQGIIERAYKQSGQKVVVLIDEYDSPLLNVIDEEEKLSETRDIMLNFYSPLKDCDPYLRFVFITGITKFSQLSIFSKLNNLKNISMLPDYGGICGISEEEIQTQMKDDLELLAKRLEISPEETFAKLKEQYDGYHFAWPSDDIYNPFSLLSAFDAGRINSYWFETGTPSSLIKLLKKYEMAPQEIGPVELFSDSFDAPVENMEKITPVLYQSGYLTIKGYDPELEIYTLDIPNKEVKIGLMRALLKNYISPSEKADSFISQICKNLSRDNMDESLRLLKVFLSTIPYCSHVNSEGHYQQMLYVIFSLLGKYSSIDVEVRTAQGRVDMVLRTKQKLYLVEVKMNQDAKKALEQINLKDYSSRFALSHLPIVKVGINFDAKKRTLSDWVIES